MARPRACQSLDADASIGPCDRIGHAAM